MSDVRFKDIRVGTRATKALATLVALNCLLLLPTWTRHRGLEPHLVALEAGLIVAVFLVLPRRPWSAALAGVAGLATVLAAVVGLGDTAARLSLARPLNLYLDVRLTGAVANLLDGSLGAGRGTLLLVVLAAVALASAAVLGVLLAGLRPTRQGVGARLPGAALLMACAAAVPLRWEHPKGVVLGLPATALVREQADQLGRMLQERERFAGELAAAPAAAGHGDGLLRGLGGRDVILSFIESYGVSALEDPRYRPVVQPRLEALDARFRAEGIHVVTGLLEAPSQGGMSWLGHGSLLSGLWLDNQLRYDLLMASSRPTLVDDFEAAGYRTAAVMPAITLAWPEGERLGYDEIWAHKDIPYAGPALHWVTMPDQYTWSFLETRVRRVEDGRPLFAELGLISSHAPWTPILDVVDDWDSVGDGSIFAPWAHGGETPQELWRDDDRVRAHYARAVAYAVDVMGSYVARYLDERTLVLALGDHQPAPLITGDDASRAVPVHVMARDAGVLEPFLDWGFTPGMLPAPDAPVRRMDTFRPWFVEAFSGVDPQVADQ